MTEGEWLAARPGLLYPRERPGTNYTGDWVGPRAGLDGWKISPHRDSIPGPSSPYSVAIPTELPGPLIQTYIYIYTGLFISPSGISELDCATTKTDTAERSISIGTESLQVFFVLGALAYFQVPPIGGSRD